MVKIHKSGVCAERVPEQENWWFIRGAAMMRKIYMEGPIGVRDLRKEFGKKRRMGVRPARYTRHQAQSQESSCSSLKRQDMSPRQRKTRDTLEG